MSTELIDFGLNQIHVNLTAVNYNQSLSHFVEQININLVTSTTIEKLQQQNASMNNSSSSVESIVNDKDEILDSRICVSWQKLLLVIFFCLLIVVTVAGNTLVILSVLTTRRLRTVTNCFVLSLAVADWLVGIFVLPPAVLQFISGAWRLGWILCDVWISLDVLLCTASILSLCAISVDRYLAVTQPLSYSKRRRSKRLACFMILIVWSVALIITSAPFFGWYDLESRDANPSDCHYNKNLGYVIFSAMGSFFIPMCIMVYVYCKIFCVLTSRQQSIHKTEASERSCEIEPDFFTSETDQRRAEIVIKLSRSSNNVSTVSSETSEASSSRQTLYELVNMSRKNRSSLRSLPVPSKYPVVPPPGKGAYHSVQFEKSSATTDSNTSENRIRIHSQGGGVPIRISSLKRETKTARTLSMVVGGFILCWFPFFIYYLLMPFLPQDSVNELLAQIFTWLGWTNSTINPFIYSFYSVDFRAAFWRLTLRRFFKSPRKAPFNSKSMSIRR